MVLCHVLTCDFETSSDGIWCLRPIAVITHYMSAYETVAIGFVLHFGI